MRGKLTSLTLWWLAGAVAALQAADNFVPPRLTRPVEPTYPKGLHEAGVEGQVEAVFRVDRQGDVVDPDVSYATHPEFAEAVKAVLAKWRFTPARRDGRPVEQRVRMPVIFSISANDPLSKWAGRNVFKRFENEPIEADELGVWPEPVAWIEPFYPTQLNGTGKRGEVVVNFVVDEHGDVVNPEVLVGDDPHFIASALAATISLEFSPHMTDDGPIPVTMAVSYKFDERKQEQWERISEGPSR
jgi:TonB family protein